MKPVGSFTIVPSLPERIARLRELALNLWWCWEHEAIDLLRRLDEDLWDSPDVYHNPVKMLNIVPQKRLQELSEDEGFLAQYDRVVKWMDAYMEADVKGATWFRRTYPDAAKSCYAYFSAEFGLNECLPIYSGGLGLLAGDHLKSASDLGIPLVGVGLLYQQGYFQQYLNNDGWQQEGYPINDFYSMPLQKAVRNDGTQAFVEVSLPGRAVRAAIWKVQVGRVPVYLLDTNIRENSREDRDITDQLYGGNQEMRIKQEILLGVGGKRALAELGIRPTVFHMNEGHSAFLAVERLREMVQEEKKPFAEALEITEASTVFTTHTPVPAGNDRFAPELIDRYLYGYYAALGLSREQFLALGQENPGNVHSEFCMTALAIRLAAHTNGVSRLHGRVARGMWKHLWPGLPVEEVPIASITNGVHARSWISNDMGWLFNRYLGTRWMERPADQTIWQAISRIPDEELWRTHERRRERLVAFARRRLRSQLERRGATRREIQSAGEVLNPDVLTVGFARRFATYKRADLLLRDPDRLIALLTNKERPVQIIFAGKAHPADSPGKELIRKIIHFIRLNDELRRHVAFIEDYDINVARYLVQGVDVWLNTPRRPLEASGTSGMKAAANGVLNVSILDGWWDEAVRDNPGVDVGWAIGNGEEYRESESEYQDEIESRALFNLLEKEVVPLFYDRSSDGVPRGWTERMKASMRTLCPVFNTNRMVCEYTGRFYRDAENRWRDITADECKKARDLAAWKTRVFREWHNVRVTRIESDHVNELPVGKMLHVLATVSLGNLLPADVSVQVYHGRLDSHGEIVEGTATNMSFVSQGSDAVFEGDVPAIGSGQHGFAIRVVPFHPDLSNPFATGLITWSPESLG